MRRMRLGIVNVMLVLLVSLAGGLRLASAQDTATQQPATAKETGYAIKKPVFGGACPVCPWGAMGEVVKAAMKPYGWDVQLCYYCAGGPRELRIVADALMAAGPSAPLEVGRTPREVRIVADARMASPPENPTAETLPTPKGPVDFGATGAVYLQTAYLGINDFADDPKGPRKHLRIIANIQEPAYYIVAVKASSGITDLRQIVERRMPVKMVVRSILGWLTTPAVLAYYGLSKEKVESFGGSYTDAYSRDADMDVFIGYGQLTNAPEYNGWYAATQKYDLKYLELPKDLRAKLAKEFYLEERNIPLGLFRGVDRPIPTVATNGTVIYGRTDMPDDFAYTLAKAMDEHQEMLAWTHMNWSYNWRTVWKAFDVPLHPGAARYYRERGYMK